MDGDNVTATLWQFWCFGVGGSILGAALLAMEVLGLRFARWLRAVLAGLFASLAAATWLVELSLGARLSSAALAVLLFSSWVSDGPRLRNFARASLGRWGTCALAIVACLVSAAWLTPRFDAPVFDSRASEATVSAGAQSSGTRMDHCLAAGNEKGLREAEEYLNEQILETARRCQRVPLESHSASATRLNPIPDQASMSPVASTAPRSPDRASTLVTNSARKMPLGDRPAGAGRADSFCFGQLVDRPPAPSVAVYEAARSSPQSPPAHTSTGHSTWKRVPEDTTRTLGGEVILANDRVAVLFRRGGPGPELYGLADGLGQRRALLTPATDGVPACLQSVAIIESSADQCTLDAAFRTSDGREVAIRFELQAGQAFVKTTRRAGVADLRIEAPCRFAVLPDFFGDDIVFDAESLAVDTAALPSENFLMHLVGCGEALVVAVWTDRGEEVQVSLAARGGGRSIQASKIGYGAEGVVFVALLESPGIWHRHDVGPVDAGQTVGLDWQSPFSAQWRVDWRDKDGLTASWQMLEEKADGSFVKVDWFGQPEEDGTPEWLKSNRHRWTPHLGSYPYPCWVDRNGRGWLQPLAGPSAGFQGPALVYPLHRTTATPLDALTLVDVMRATLGVGPCEYMLDVEAQRGTMRGVPTCVTRQKLMAIYGNKEQKTRRAEVERALDDVGVFLRHIRMRIDTYGVFGGQMLAFLDGQKRTHPELSGFLEDMETIARRISEAIEGHRIGIGTPEQVARSIQEFRATLLDYDGDDARYQCNKVFAALTAVGGNQDIVVCQCREAVKVLRARAAQAMAADPRTAPVAEEIRRLTHAMLRNPTSFEAPRH